MATELATAYISLVPSARGIKGNITRELGGAGTAAARTTEDAFSGSIKRTGRNYKAMFRTAALGGAAIIAGGAVAIKSVVDSASNLNEAQSKVNAIFGPEGQAQVDKWAAKAVSAFGQSKIQATDAIGTYGNLLTSFGLGKADALDMSQTLTGLASDLASFNNTSVDEAIQALRSGLTGETEPLKRYGVAIDEASLKAKALSMGLIDAEVDVTKVDAALLSQEKAVTAAAAATKKFGAGSLEARTAQNKLETATAALAKVMKGKIPAALTPAQKAQASYALILERTKNAQGDFTRTSGGLANQQRIFAARWENLKVTIGKGLLPVVNKLMPVIGRLFSQIEPFAQRTGPKMNQLFAKLGAWWSSNGPKVTATIKDVFDGIRVGVAVAVDAVRKNWPQIQTTISEVVVTVKSVLASLQSIVKSTVDFVQMVWKNFGADITRVARGAWNNVRQIIGGQLEIIRGIWNTIAAALRGDWGGVWEGIKQIVHGAFNVIVGTVKNAGELLRLAAKVTLETMDAAWRAGWEGIKKVPGLAWEGIKIAVAYGAQWLVDQMAKLPGRLTSVFSGLFDGIKEAFRLALNWVIDKWNGFKLPKQHITGTDIDIGGYGLPQIDRLEKFHSGGIVPGSPGADVPIMAQAGERIVPRRQARGRDLGITINVASTSPRALADEILWKAV